MGFLIISILANVGIMLCFKAFSKYELDTFQAIVINYLTCVVTGVLFIGDLDQISSFDPFALWVPWACVLGVVFISGFYLIAVTTQRMGITVASVANKMSLIIPVLMSILVFQIQSKVYDYINYIGIFLALVSVVLTSIKQKKRDSSTLPVNVKIFLLPMGVFLFGGFIDTTINYVNFSYVKEQDEAIFPIVIFGAAFIIGGITLIIQRARIKPKNVLGGITLGIINYFSIYFLVKGLSSFNNDGALVYPVLNVGIILFSALASVILFHERLSRLNKVGLVVAVLAIFSIFYQEINTYLN